MSLTDLLKRLSRPAVFGLALAVSPVYSCGGEESSKACVSDTECKGEDRVCADGQCVYRDGKGDSGSSEEGPCGNSPLNGKYLWEIWGCDLALFMRTDCWVDSYRGSEVDNSVTFHPAACQYQSFVLDCNEDDLHGEFRADLKYSNSPAVNGYLDQYGGFIFVKSKPGFNPNESAKRAWIPLEEKYPGTIDCSSRFDQIERDW